MLVLRDIQKTYHSRTLFQQTSLRLPNGIYWLQGANGAGKTTLLKMVAGLLPFDGDAVFNDISQKQKPVLYRQQIGWAEAEPLFPDFIAGRDLVSLYRDVRRATQKDVDDLLLLFGLHQFIDEAIKTYSAGMVKKLSLVLAFIGNPSLCLLDEPLITLDAAAFDAVSTYIIDRHKSGGTMFLLSSHQEMSPRLEQCSRKLSITNQRIALLP